MSDESEPPKFQYRELFTNPAARRYFFLGSGGLAVVLLTTFLFGSPIAAAMLFVIGLCGLVLRWTIAPITVAMLVAYFSLAPLGIPVDLDPYSQVPASHFRAYDLVVLGGTLTYLFAQYRLFSVVQTGMPFEAAKSFVKSSAKPTVRPAEDLPSGEVGRFFVRVVGYLLAGQLIWAFLTYFRVDFASVPPLRWMPPVDPAQSYMNSRLGRTFSEPMVLGEVGSRVVIGATLLLLVGGLIRFAFWYAEMIRMSRDQARLVLSDTAWLELRRELNRQEKWRGHAIDSQPGIARPGFGCGSLVFVAWLPMLMLFVSLVIFCCAGGWRSL